MRKGGKVEVFSGGGAAESDKCSRSELEAGLAPAAFSEMVMD